MVDWVHTRRGIMLVEGTLPRIADGLFKVARQLEIANTPRHSVEQVQSELLAATLLLAKLVDAGENALLVEGDGSMTFEWAPELKGAMENAKAFVALRKEEK